MINGLFSVTTEAMAFEKLKFSKMPTKFILIKNE
jgi:hypothetical protein